MKINSLLILTCIFLLSACDQITSNSDNPDQDKTQHSEENLSLADQPDKSFIAFFETFMFDKDFQTQRINFPLRFNKKISTREEQYVIKTISQKDWNQRYFFSNDEFIPVLRPDTLRYYKKDVQTTKIQLCMYNHLEPILDTYEFYKNGAGQWELRNINQIGHDRVKDKKFLDFLLQFSQDSSFQKSHVEFPLHHCIADADAGYAVACDSLKLENWQHLNFSKSLEKMLILNQESTYSKYRNVYFRGVENGIYMSYYFKRIKNTWKLIYSEDLST